MRSHPAILTIAAATLALPATTTPADPPLPTNCTQSFDHTDSLEDLVDQLRDDDVRHNLTRALPVLLSHPDLSPDFLYAQLTHEDWQVRQVMCEIIWSRAFPPPARRAYHAWLERHLSDPAAAPAKLNPDYPITQTLVRVTIEGLAHDTTPYDTARRRGLCYNNALLGLRVLPVVAHDFAPMLSQAMDSDDPQQRILAAAILGYAGIGADAERAAQILLPHLRDNDMYEDAKFCAPALAGFGHALLPHLSEALPAADHQQRELILLLIRDIKDPPSTERQRRANARYNRITTAVHDPVATPAPISLAWLDQLYRD